MFITLGANALFNPPRPYPARRFASPEVLMAAPHLSEAEKFNLLAEWEADLSSEMRAQPAQDGRIADIAGRVRLALAQIGERLAP